MRQLNQHDVFMAARVLQKLGVKDELIDFVQYVNNRGKEEPDKEKLKEQVGIKLVFGMIANTGDEAVEKAWYAFAAGPLEMEPEEIADLGLPQSRELIEKWLDKYRDGLSDFFHYVIAAFKKMK